MTQTHSPPIALEAFCTSGNSPTVHLLGVGAVGRAFLRQSDDAPWNVVAATDRSGTVHQRSGLAGAAIARWKSSGQPLVEFDQAQDIPTELALDLVGADFVIDATASDSAEATTALTRSLRVIHRGSGVVFASKHALALGADQLLGGDSARVGLNATLGGTGLAFRRELDHLRDTTTEVEIVGNATTTAVIERTETLGDAAAGYRFAQSVGLLESDPALDIRGTDAATKLAIVRRALWGQGSIEDVRSTQLELDPERVRWEAERGRPTRLVATAHRGGEFSVSYLALARHSPLAVPWDRVAYCYHTGPDRRRIHIGTGLGPDATARALVEDVQELVANATVGGAR